MGTRAIRKGGLLRFQGKRGHAFLPRLPSCPARKDRRMTREELIGIASRYDTALSRAMLRACGVFFVRVEKMRTKKPKVHGRYRGILACMRNRRSPMDW